MHEGFHSGQIAPAREVTKGSRSLAADGSPRHWPTAMLFFLVGLLLSGGPISAQTSQFLPEIDLYHRFTRDVRFTFQSKETREAGDPTQAAIGPSFDFYLKPLMRLKDASAFDLDDSKSRLLQLSAGFRYVSSADKPATQRFELAATSHFPTMGKILLSDRNRADLDWSSGRFTWRYRNRITLERRIKLGSHHPAPYLSAEAFYQSQYTKWSTTALYAGCLFAVGKHFEFDPYYEHQNITGKHPNQQLNQFGLILSLYF